MEKKIQLFLLPFAGGSSLSFMRLNRFLDKSVEAITIEYPGRGKRNNEKFIDDYDSFVKDIEHEIVKKRIIELPFAILGYSMGSAIAYDLIRSGKFDQSASCGIFCAEGGLISPNPARRYGECCYQEFLEKMQSLGGIDKRLLENEEALKSYLHIIKKDFDILAQFKYDGGKIGQDITVIYSEYDNTCVNMDEWEKITVGNVNYRTLGDNHFFLNQCYKEMANIINNQLKEWTYEKNDSEIVG